MRIWQVALLVNLSLMVGLGIGYSAWGRRVSALDGEVAAALARADQLGREREACFAGGRLGEQLWEGHGIVRAVYPRIVVITHEEISGLLPARTTGFRWADSGQRAEAHAGDPVRFWLRGEGLDTSALVKIEAW